MADFDDLLLIVQMTGKVSQSETFWAQLIGG